MEIKIEQSQELQLILLCSTKYYGAYMFPNLKT